jgi:predicted enzyme related to lactoylglutathione lyase
MPRPIHFEIHADNPSRAIKFYETLFGWQFTKWEGPMEYWLITTGSGGTPGIDGGLVKRMGATA